MKLHLIPLVFSVITLAANRQPNAGRLPFYESGKLHVVYERPSHDTSEVGRTQILELKKNEKLESYRVESFGDTELTLTLTGQKGIRPSLYIEGPLDNYGDDVPVGSGPMLAWTSAGKDSSKLVYHLKLPAKGIYRVLPGTHELFQSSQLPDDGATLSLESACKKNCYHPSVAPSVIQKELASPETRKVIFNKIDTALKEHVKDEKTREALLKKLHEQRGNDQRLKTLDRGLILPRIDHSLGLSPYLSMFNAPLEKPTTLNEPLETVVKSRPMARDAKPDLLNETGVEIRYGHFVDNTLTRQQLEESGGLARALTALAANNGTTIRVKGVRDSGGSRETKTPGELFQALMDSGHKVELRQVRTQANFLAFVVNGKDVRLPAWTDTGIKLSNGETLKIPMGHSEYVWKVSGPSVNTQVAFYQGMTGTGFFPKVDARPEWTGQITKQIIRSGEGRDELITKAADVGAAYYRRIQAEASTVAKGLPAEGYGITGVCNDSIAAIQLAMGFSRISLPYPLVRAKKFASVPEEFKNDPRFQDNFADVFAQFPYDGDLTSQELNNPEITHAILCRILSMLPYPLDSDVFKDMGLLDYQRQLKLAREMVKGKCPTTFTESSPIKTH